MAIFVACSLGLRAIPITEELCGPELLLSGTHHRRTQLPQQPVQLNLRNGETLSLLSHGGKEQIYVDLIRTALFLDKPAVIPEA